MREEVRGFRKGVLEADITFFEGKRVSLGELEAACLSPPFLSPQRIIILEGILSGLNLPPVKKKFSELARSLPSTTFLIILDEEDKFPLNLCPQARIKRFIPPRGDRLKQWILSRVEGEEGGISPEAISFLYEFSTGDLGMLSGEVTKLLLYAHDRRIEKEDVVKLTSLSLKGSIFSLMDSILEGHTSKALGVLHWLLLSGATPSYVLSMLCRQFRLLIQAKEFMDQDLPSTSISDALGLQGFALSKILSQAENHSLPELTSAYTKLAKADLHVKSGGQPRLTLDILLTELMVKV